MKDKKKIWIIGISLFIIFILLIIMNKKEKADLLVVTLPSGNYYLDGEKENPYISIINEKELQFINFDLSQITEIIYNAIILEDTIDETIFSKKLYYEQQINGNYIEIDIPLVEYSVGLMLTFYPANQTIKFNDEVYYFMEELK